MAASGAEARAGSWELVGKALVGFAVVVAILATWLGSLYYQAMNEPLPGSGGRQGQCVIWFVGSSSIANWTTLDQDMRPWTVHNRGVGGAKLSQIVRRFGNDQDAPAPEAIVFYAGENDIAAGIPVDQAFGAFRSFMAVKEQRLGRTPMFFISLKPTPKRWSMRQQQARYNMLARRLAAERTDLTYVDIVPDMLVNGRPGPLFDRSGIHLLPIGHARWTRRVQEALRRMLPNMTARCIGSSPAGGQTR